jgi:hypothetical protein
MRAYYAHCKVIYGTPQEARDIALLQSLGFEVVNPADKQYEQAWAEQGMALKEKFADECDLIIFRSLPDLRIPAGVAKEIEAFKVRSKAVLELPSGLSCRAITVEQTREYLAEVGQR